MSDPAMTNSEISGELLITVYIPNYNYACYIERAVRSVLDQTLQSFELIIIDDGSTDNSKEVLERFIDLQRVSIIYQDNQGLLKTSNNALGLARGKYIMRLDADDYLDPHALEILAGAMERNPEVGLVFPDYFVVDEQCNVIEFTRRHEFENVSLLDQPAHGACTLIRTDAIRSLGGYNEQYSCQDGYELWLRFVKQFPVQNVNLPLFYYRKHNKSLTQNEERILKTRSLILEEAAKRDGKQIEKVIGIVPVRGSSIDSESVPLRKLGDKSLIDWTLNAAIDSNRLSQIVVTTPDDEVLKYVSNKFKDKVIPHKRSLELARINSGIEDTLTEAVESVGFSMLERSAVVVLYVESPFKKAYQIDSLIHVMEVFDTDCVLAVRPERDSFYRHKGAGLEPLYNSGVLRLEREVLFRDTGQMLAVRGSFLSSQKNIPGGKIGHLIVDPISAIRVGTNLEWEIAEMSLRCVK